ncbi:putative copper resistance-associated P-type ATPase [Aspergillus glaucus CBS 516.65]|uniref:HMA domain-containing protein n=1 Tax=Aspergillus glaucus CBS 516.65 TaxID=1160497 RepID=A0A1L9VU56_ASPGL|nr:hypothetical protein ASPGLDRAFT_44011 [Aspergillus glaucus CBS 516.65]OJJ87461.1 hypothetical protein ASPGLDRAFT_44011 [Aspergillus glaucus CBS 516.65]
MEDKKNNVVEAFGPHSPVREPRCLRSTFFVSNVHCSSCVAYINVILSDIPAVRAVEVNILTHEVHVRHGVEVGAPRLATALVQAAFEVHHVTTYDDIEGSVVSEIDTTSLLPRDSILFSSVRASYPKLPLKNKQHIANCDACRKESQDRLSWSPRPEKNGLFRRESSCVAPLAASNRGVLCPDYKKEDSDVESLVPRASPMAMEAVQPLDPASLSAPQQMEEEFNARISIGGMSCASCVNTVTNEVKELEFIKDVVVNLLTNSAMLVYTGPKSNIDRVIDQIEDIGFEASLDEVNAASQPSRAPTAFVAEIAITGMTCGSCVGAVTGAIEELSFVTHVSVNLLSHSGMIEFEGEDKANAIVEKVEDIGFDASLASVHPLAAQKDDNDEIKPRTVSIGVDGMFCHHCPEKVLGSLNALTDVVIEEPLSIKNPILKLTYTPRPSSFTVRNLLSTVESAHDTFKATVYHPPSVEDRSRAIQLHERRRLLCRLLFVFTVTIPTFLIGVVFMSLVSSNNPTRMYLEQPMWAGSASRMEWSLFIMTTPVMFYGTDIFHVRAMKEVHALWRPGSRVPFLQRFCRFGSMNLLISAGTTVAYLSSLAVLIVDAAAGIDKSAQMHSSTYFDTVVFLTLFILAGRFMEAYSKAKTGDAVASLGKLRPSEALLVERLVTPDDEKSEVIRRINIDLLEIGDIVSIPHGASPPADGTVTNTIGTSQFDESSLTGESKPVKKAADDQVYTGSVNVGQPVQIRVSAIGGSSMLDQIISVVREGQSRRAPLERVADMLTSHFVPIITLIAILTFLVWLSLGLSGALPDDYLDVSRGGWTFWSLEFAIAVFVVACPCGLALAAPTALFVGGGLAARHGILVKGGGEAFQEASRLDAIVFDKTGTLTEGGSLKVSEHEVLSNTNDSTEMQIAWTLAKKLEESSNHPIARAIMEFCNDKPAASVRSSEIQELSGKGMKGVFTVSTPETKEPVQYEAAIGNERLLHELASPDTDTYYISTLLSKYQSTGKSTAILSLRKINPDTLEKSPFIPVLVFAISDLIRPEAAQIISDLQKRRVNVYMCTGDNHTTATAVADMVGIPRSNVMANVLPAGKADFVRQIQESSPSDNQKKTRSIVGFIGDGVNDSPALAAADVSIALSTGSDVALSSASFILLNSSLTTILHLVLLSRRVFNRVRMNFGWALVYNLCLIPVAAGVFYPIVSGHRDVMGSNGEVVGVVDTHWRLSPVWAALAMALSSVSVVCSSLVLGVEDRVWKFFGGEK